MLENETETDACLRICLASNWTRARTLKPLASTEAAYIEGATARNIILLLKIASKN